METIYGAVEPFTGLIILNFHDVIIDVPDSKT
jgi:hypothetical protein